ncbi:MAG: rhodanese-related sulfurtransferase [Chitinophagales bacterium]|jgi:rhodanese-related sulfurtransferase
MYKGILGAALLSILLVSCKDSQATTESTVDVVLDNEIEESVAEVMQIETAHLLLKPALFKTKLDNDENFMLLDIRTPAELTENGTIEGAKNVDFYTEDFKANMDAMDREVPVMLFCRSGGRSGEAASLLKEMGFKQVYDLNGGYNAWLEAGY